MRRTGFTLVELVISTAVILMMLAVSLPAFVDFQRRQDLVSGGQHLRDAIIEAQNLALAPRGSLAEEENKAAGADYYRIVFFTDGDANRYQIDEQQYNDPVAQTIDLQNPAWRTVKSGVLPNRISYCSFSHPDLTSTQENALNDNRKGLVYSIRQQGKIVAPLISGNLDIRLVNKASGEQSTLAIQVDTGRVDITVPDTQQTCSI